MVLGRRNVFVTKALVLARTRVVKTTGGRRALKREHSKYARNVGRNRTPGVEPLPRFIVLHLEFAKGVLGSRGWLKDNSMFL